jgi:hypothetical protein
LPNIDSLIEVTGYQTRVVAFIYDTEDFENEMTAFEAVAFHNAERPNLRMAMITDKKLIKTMKN